jgi:hypothetical protein
MKQPRKIKEITANRLVLKSPLGKVRVLLDASSEDAVFVQLHGQGSAKLVLCIDSDGNPKAMFEHKTGGTAISMGIADDVGTGITLHDREGRPVCFISVPGDGIPRVAMTQFVVPMRSKTFWETPKPKPKTKKA